MDMEQLETNARVHWKMPRPWLRSESEKWIYEIGFFWGLTLHAGSDAETMAAAEFLSGIAETRYHMAREEQEANQEQKNDK